MYRRFDSTWDYTDQPSESRLLYRRFGHIEAGYVSRVDIIVEMFYRKRVLFNKLSVFLYGNEIFVEVLREGVAEACVQFVRAISRSIDWNAREVEQK